MLNGEIAKAQIEDRIREAQRDRMALGSSKRKESRQVVRKVGSGILAALISTLASRPAPMPPAARVTQR